MNSVGICEICGENGANVFKGTGEEPSSPGGGWYHPKCLSSPAATESLWSRVVRGEGCWLWSGSKNFRGYGNVRRNGVTYLTHRYLLSLLRRVPKGSVVLHQCDTPGCVRPSHLRVGTQKANVRDCVAKGRHRNGATGKLGLRVGEPKGDLRRVP